MAPGASHRDVPMRVRKRIMALHGADERPEEAYAALRADLDSVPKPKRGLRWRHVDVLLDVHFRFYGRRVIRRLNRLRETYAQRDELGRFEMLWTNVQRLLGDVTVTTHGYNPRLSTRSADRLWSQVSNVVDRLDEAGHSSFVSSGTLLGIVRGDGVIANDDDVDLAVLLKATSSDAAAHEWLELRARLREAGLVDAEFDDLAYVHTTASSPDGLKIDLFPGWFSDRRLYLFPYSYGDVSVDDTLPLTSLVVNGTMHVPGPAHPEALLEANYGVDWRTPDPLFMFDWRSAKDRFGHFRAIVTGKTNAP